MSCASSTTNHGSQEHVTTSYVTIDDNHHTMAGNCTSNLKDKLVKIAFFSVFCTASIVQGKLHSKIDILNQLHQHAQIGHEHTKQTLSMQINQLQMYSILFNQECIPLISLAF